MNNDEQKRIRSKYRIVSDGEEYKVQHVVDRVLSANRAFCTSEYEDVWKDICNFEYCPIIYKNIQDAKRAKEDYIHSEIAEIDKLNREWKVVEDDI